MHDVGDVARRHGTRSLLTCSSLKTSLGMTKMTSSLAFAFVSGHGLCRRCFPWHLSWHPYGCPSRYGRCPLEYPLSWLSMSTIMWKHLKAYMGCCVEHASKYSWLPERCHTGHPYMLISMYTWPCKTTIAIVFDVSLCVRSVQLDYNGVHMMFVWMYAWLLMTSDITIKQNFNVFGLFVSKAKIHCKSARAVKLLSSNCASSTYCQLRYERTAN